MTREQLIAELQSGGQGGGVPPEGDVLWIMGLVDQYAYEQYKKGYNDGYDYGQGA